MTAYELGSAPSLTAHILRWELLYTTEINAEQSDLISTATIHKVQINVDTSTWTA